MSLSDYLSLSFFNRQEFIFNRSWMKEFNRINKKLENLITNAARRKGKERDKTDLIQFTMIKIH